MAEYYFVSQLPSLDGMSEDAPLPITPERFDELCRRFLAPAAQETMRRITLSPAKQFEASGCALLDGWNELERNLRFALGKVRAERMNKPFDTENRALPAHYLKAAATAAEAEDPMQTEKFLCRYRLELLETLRPTDGFSEDYLFYYGLKLKLLARIRQFDAEAGEQAYKKIYRSILHGEGQEVTP